jgi:dihydrofolate synthase/folylpolyglutamate synthase
MAGTYAEALEYIHSLYRFGSRLGLGRVRRLLAELGDPHLGLRVVHVAGTNGKGSVAAMTASVLQAAGYRTGLYISPYLSDFRERISIDGRPISPEETAQLVFDFLKPAAERVEGAGAALAGGPPPDPITEFEFVTALGFLHFARGQVDFLVGEVGLGGRFDATNVIDRPLLAVITSIGLDHTDRLGPTVEAIAAEKAGIIKRSAPVVSAPQSEAGALAVIRAAARRRDCPFYLAGRDSRLAVEAVSLRGQTVSFAGPGFPWPEAGLHLPLLGRHQVDNAVTALTALGVLRERGLAPALDGRALGDGLARTSWPGRFEVFGDHPPIVIDGAHNPPGARALASTLREYLSGRRIFLVLGLLGDKDVDQFLSLVLPPALPEVAGVFACRPDNPRAMAAERLAELVAEHGARCAQGLPVTVVPNVGTALRLALAAAGPDDAVCVAGSLYQVGAARQAAKDLVG